MVPAYLEHLAVIPMMPSDKADRKSLPAPDGRARRWRRREPTSRRPAPTETVLADAAGRDPGGRAGVGRRPLLRRPRRELAAAGAVLRAGARAEPGCRRCHAGRVPAPDASPALAALAGAGAAPGAGRRCPRRRATASRPHGTLRYVCCAGRCSVLFLVSLTVARRAAGGRPRVAAPRRGCVGIYLRSVVVRHRHVRRPASCCRSLAKWLLVGRWRPQEIPLWSLALPAVLVVKR